MDYNLNLLNFKEEFKAGFYHKFRGGLRNVWGLGIGFALQLLPFILTSPASIFPWCFVKHDSIQWAMETIIKGLFLITTARDPPFMQHAV